MISLPFRRPAQNPSIDALYGMIVAQARAPSFYLSYGVADTVSGRLDMIVLHLMLVMRRLADLGAEAGVGQPLFDRFCRDMDGNFREMGIGDLAVPKQMQRVTEAFYGRTRVYRAALAGAVPQDLEMAVARNVFGAAEPTLGARRLAAYMREATQRLSGQGLEALAAGQAAFPDPDTIQN